MKTGTHFLGENLTGERVFVKPFGQGTNGLVVEAVDRFGKRSTINLSGHQAQLLKDVLS